MTSSRYCFTLNNPQDDDEGNLKANFLAHCKYAVFGREVGESGTPHLQGFCIFRKRCGLLAAKDRLNPRVHLEVARGSPRENRTYCSKSGDYYEQGECPDSGASSGKSSKDEIATDFVESVSRGESGMAEFATRRPGAYYFSRHVLLRNLLAAKPTVERPGIHVRWFCGPPGTGKSRRAHEEMPRAYIKEPRTKWWNGYKLETDVIIDDFGPNGIDINHLLRWFDRYKCLVEVKGDMVPLYADNFIVTSNFHPEELFQVKDVSLSMINYVSHPQIAALMRRINIVTFE